MADEYNEDAFRVMRGAIDAEHENERALRACREEVGRLREALERLTRVFNDHDAQANHDRANHLRELSVAGDKLESLRAQLADAEADREEYRRRIHSVLRTSADPTTINARVLRTALVDADAACAARRATRG